jgi:tetratricopeptide (TPR) repeat protein
MGTSSEKTPGAAQPASDPNMIRVLDETGRELFITKEQWRTGLLPGALKSGWNDPERLYGLIMTSLNDGFVADVLNAAERLYRIDPIVDRGAAIYAIVLMKSQRLDDAERVLLDYVQKHGEAPYILTNLAKVYAERNESQKAMQTLWRAIELDPNQENGLGWYAAIHRERSGEQAAQEALRRVAALSGSWRAQLWLAQAAMDTRDLETALGYYREILSKAGEGVPAYFLMQMGGDLGRHGHLKELISLTEPKFVARLHGMQVGNNLIKAHLDLGDVEGARKIWEQIHVLNRPEYQQHLNFWAAEIAKVEQGLKT